MVRVVFGVVVGAAASALGALILGEYEFTGATPYVAGLLFGLVVAEVVVSIAGRRSIVIGLVCAALVAGALLWAGWISSGEGLRPLPTSVYVAMGIAAVCAAARAGRWARAPG